MRKKAVVIVLGVLLLASFAGLTAFRPFDYGAAAAANQIAVIYIDGTIVGGRGQAGLFGGGGTDDLIKQLHQARDDGGVKAIVLRINSPGGSAPAAQEVGEELRKIRAGGKPVVTSMGDMAASGGYWLAACTDRIYANPSTLTGSIGVYVPYSNWEELYKKIGVKPGKIKSGPHKDMLSPDRPMTDEERALVQTIVDDIYEQFVTVVAEGRHLEPARVRQLADGRLYTGRQAQKVGLVDELGNLYDAVGGAARLAGLTGKPRVKEYAPGGPWERLLGVSGQTAFFRQWLLREAAGTPAATPLAREGGWGRE